MTSGIYVIEDSGGRRYVGSAADIGSRWRRHRSDLRHGKHHNRFLQRAWRKYGEAAFRFEVLEEWEPRFLVSMEQWWINALSPAYNNCVVAGSSKGIRRSADFKRRVRAALTGRKRPATVVEAMYGRRPSEKTRQKMSAAQKRRWARE